MIKAKRRASHIRQTRADRIFQTVIVALGVVLMILVAYPLYFTIIASFSKPEDVLMGRVILWPRNISFESYKMVVAERDIWTATATPSSIPCWAPPSTWSSPP